MAECFFLKGRSTEFAIPIMLVLHAFVFVLVRTALIRVVKLFSLLLN